MAIAEIANSDAGAPIKGPQCSVCMELARIDPSEAEGLRSLLANPRWRYTEISARLREDPDTPLNLHQGALSRHAKGECSAREKLR